MRREVNLTLTVRRMEVHQTGNPTFYLNYAGPLRGNLSSRFVKTDFTRAELLLFPLVEAPLQISYSDCRGRTKTLRVYSLEEILTEKLCALVGRTEPRDLYDIHYLLTEQLVDTEAEAVSFRLGEKMAHKGLEQTALSDVLARRQDTLKRLWQPRLGGQMPDLPHFDWLDMPISMSSSGKPNNGCGRMGWLSIGQSRFSKIVKDYQQGMPIDTTFSG